MNETVANNIAASDLESIDGLSSASRINWSFAGYSLLVAAIVAGWLLRGVNLVNPEEGLGYWLGIVGGLLMLVLLFYPVMKKSRLLRRLGLIQHSFRIHMIFGLVGPLLILYHCNFSVDAINSEVALYAMLAVAISGVVGRHFYARIHRGLYGSRTSIEELRDEISTSMDQSRGLAVILPGFVAKLHDFSEELLGDRYTKTIGIRRSLVWTVKHFYVRAALSVKIRQELREKAMQSEIILENAAELRRTANQYARSQVGIMRRVAQLSFYERLFSLWHVFHMPLFLLLIISASVHVLAVHMY